MVFDELKPTKRSLGSLRKAAKTKHRSPDTTGTLKLQRHTLETFVKQVEEQDADEIDCCIAGWRNVDANGQRYLFVEILPKYVARRREETNSNLEEFI